jgi:hypothetical protein
MRCEHGKVVFRGINYRETEGHSEISKPFYAFVDYARKGNLIYFFARIRNKGGAPWARLN